MKTIIWIACIIYCLVPDFVIGPLDDTIVCIATAGLTAFMSGGNNNNNGIEQKK